MRNPLHTYAGLLERSAFMYHVYLHNNLDVPAVAFYVHTTVDDAYGDPLDSGVGGAGAVGLAPVNRGGTFRSPTLRRLKLGLIEESRRGTTHFLVHQDDLAITGSVSIGPEDWIYQRAQEQRGLAALFFAGVPESIVTLAAVAATDVLIIKGVYFEFQAGANNLAGHAGTLLDPFLVGLGVGDNAAAANLTAALNDNGDVAPAMDLIAPLAAHTFATNVTPPSAVVAVQPENGTPALIGGSVAAFTVTTPDAPRIALDADTLLWGTLVWDPVGGEAVLGPIYCIPPAIYFGSPNPAFSLQATAPSSTTSAAGGLPDLDLDLTLARPRAMYLVFPKPLSALSIRNLSAVNLLVSFGPEQIMQNVPAGGELPLYSGSTKEVCLACPDGTAGAAFSLHGVTAGERA